MEQTAATIVVAGWTLYMVLTLLMPYARIIGEFDFDNEQTWEAMQEYGQMVRERLVSLRGMIELAIGFGSISWTRVNAWRKAKLRGQKVKRGVA